jgi:sugar (pentulose or hexulose) kinase
VRPTAIAVIDIGKSNAKLALVNRETLAVEKLRTLANTVVQGRPYPHYDVERLWIWLLEGFRLYATTHEIEAISVTTHGACFVLLSGDGLALPVLDYEYAGPETLSAGYAAVRGPFSETLSPDLPNGLNVGRQLYWQARTFPEQYSNADALLPYPQYWVWRLTGAEVAEATSLGCHTDMWNPRERRYSSLAEREGWDRLIPRLTHPGDVAGTVRPEIAAAAGLPPNCRVVTGIHDSNASLLPHLLSEAKPFAVLSSGTWMIVLAPGGDLDKLDAARDCLANVDAFGNAVPSARFMAGREYETLAGPASASREALAAVLADQTMALPTFATGTGPFGHQRGRWMRYGSEVHPSELTPTVRAAAASCYAAFVTETCLTLAGAKGSVIVEGPFARNSAFLGALAGVVGRPVLARPEATGTTEGAALLALGGNARPANTAAEVVTPLDLPLSPYHDVWRAECAKPSA